MKTKALYEDIKIWRDDWLRENDPQDGTDCVTPFDKWLYSSPVNDNNKQAGLSRHAFLNAVRIVYSMEPDLPATQQRAFLNSPFEFLMRADEAALTKIWADVQRRQPED